MPLIRATASAPIGAPASRIDSLIADYRDGHPHIPPREHFPRIEAGWDAPGLREFIGRVVVPPLRHRIDHREHVRLSAAVPRPEAGGGADDRRAGFRSSS